MFTLFSNVKAAHSIWLQAQTSVPWYVFSNFVTLGWVVLNIIFVCSVQRQKMAFIQEIQSVYPFVSSVNSLPAEQLGFLLPLFCVLEWEALYI